MNLYERINNLCKENQVSGVELGKRLGLKKSPLTDWKNEKSVPTLEQLKKLCDIFAISADYLLFGKIQNELTEDESKIITAFRAANETEQEIILKILKLEETKEIEKSSNYKIG